MMHKTHEGTYQILEWKGREFYRFGPQSWMELMGCSLEDVYDDVELEDAYNAQMLHDMCTAFRYRTSDCNGTASWTRNSL